MSIVFLANLVSLSGALIMVVIGFLKDKKRILNAQCIQFGILGLSNLMLGGVTGFISNLLSIARNRVCSRRAFTTPWKLLFILLQLALSLPFNRLGLLGLLPVIAAVVYTWFLDVDNPIVFKLIIMGTAVLWVIYDFALCNYVSFAFDLMNIAGNLAGILAIRRSMARPSAAA